MTRKRFELVTALGAVLMPAAGPVGGVGSLSPGAMASSAAAYLPLLVLMMLAAYGVAALRRRGRNRGIRTQLAAQLDVSPLALVALPPHVLRKLEKQVAFDELTRVMRRAPGMAAVEREIARAQRIDDMRLVVAFVDVDGLKRVNDSGGHAAGDRLLRGVAATLRDRLRKQDLVFRYGGDEFVCLLPGADLPAAERALERIQAELSASFGESFSVGLTELRPDDEAAALVSRADEALYAGRALRRRTAVQDTIGGARRNSRRARLA